MQLHEFLALLADILEVDEVLPNSSLADYEMWDSLGQLSVTSAVEEFGIDASLLDYGEFELVADLYGALEELAK
jgi:acyl carrier protein